MSNEPIVGWDIGGAHVKAAALGADGRLTHTLHLPCPLWQGMEQLEAALDRAPASLHAAPRHAITMTGEMVDLFASRAEGVARIAAALARRWPQAQLLFYAGRRGFVPLAGAAAESAAIASANWLATASYVAVQAQAGVLVDVGSTTSDIIAFARKEVLSRSTGDADRLACGELVYTGVVRTPLMALAERVPMDGAWVGVAAELFATTADAYRVLGWLDEAADQHPAADGGAKTAQASARRLARMVGRDVEDADMGSWQALAAWFAEAQLRRIADALALVLSRHRLDARAPLVSAGSGGFLVRRLAQRLQRPVVEFAELAPRADAGVPAPLVAPAVAVASLALRQEG